MTSNEQEQVKYGELVILGYNGHLPRGDHGRKRSKLTLFKRSAANGIKLSRNSITRLPDGNNHHSNNHRITYTLSNSTAVIAEYQEDEDIDMFQIGRFAAFPIDMIVMNTSSEETDVPEFRSTVSRFACRILVNRSNPKEARIFAAGFNESKNIFLGEKAIKWKKGETMDGVTTNGVLIAHPSDQFCGGDSQYSYWREVSVGGDIYSLRENRNSRQIGKFIETEDNILKDGTLINLCGATLLWRSVNGLAKSPDKYDIEELVRTINKDRLLDYSHGVNKLVIPRKLKSNSTEPRPYVFVKCGHVQCFRQRNLEKMDNKKCPTCQISSSPIRLCMGMEPAFYTDYGPPTFAFNPCGHMATEKSVRFWANVEIPNGLNGFIAMCPFCAIPLDGWPGFVELLF